MLFRSNPMYYASDAARALIEGDLGAGAVPVSFVMFAVLSAATLAWFIGLMREAVA